MFSSLYNPNWTEVFQHRLEIVQKEIAERRFPTREQYQALVQSRLNRLISHQDRMQPLIEITRESPALVGGVQDNLDLLNDDVIAVSSQLLASEQTAAALLNLYAAAQISVRQRIRQMVYTSSRTMFDEQFVGASMLDNFTCEVDLNAGIVSLPVESQTELVPSRVRISATSEGALVSTSKMEYLVDGEPHTVLEWQGRKLDLIFEFDEPVIINRIRIEPHDYDGYRIEEFSCSPDGLYHENVLSELPETARRIDAASNKFSGEYTADFTPKHVRFIKLAVVDDAGLESIRLRGVSFHSRKYSQNGFLAFKAIDLAPGIYEFSADQDESDRLTDVQHQFSADGASYRVIAPGEAVAIDGPVWYRVFMQRLETDFGEDNPYSAGLQELEASANFSATLPSVTTDLGGGAYLRELRLDTLTGPVKLKDSIVGGTLQVSVDGTPLPASGFSFSSGILTLVDVPAEDVTIRYQTSLAGQASFALRRPFYSPFLRSASFTKTA